MSALHRDDLCGCWPWRPPRAGQTRGYNGFTGRQRIELGRVQSAMFRRNPQLMRTVCQPCGGVAVHQHLEDYHRPVEGAIPACIRCHCAIHERFGHPEMWERYRAMIRDGWVFPVAGNWLSAVAGMCRSDRDFDRAVPGPKRGPGILDEIATGRWLNAGREAE